MLTKYKGITDYLIMTDDPLHQTARRVADAMGCNINNVTTGTVREVNVELEVEKVRAKLARP